MPDMVALTVVDTDGQPRTFRRCEVVALVWAIDEQQAAKAAKHLLRGWWSYWFLFRITEVRQLSPGVLCPFNLDDPAVLASAQRERWMWVLVPPGTRPSGRRPGVSFSTGNTIVNAPDRVRDGWSEP